MNRLSFLVLIGLALFAVSFNDVVASAEVVPTESECRPYIEKAIHELKTGEKEDDEVSAEQTSSTEAEPEPEPEETKASQEEEEEDAPSEDVASEQDDEENKTLETIEIADVDSTETAPEADEDEAKSAEGEDTTDDDDDDGTDAPSQEQEEAAEPETETEEVEDEPEPIEDQKSEEAEEDKKSEEVETEDAKSEETPSDDQEDEVAEEDKSEAVEEEVQPESTEDAESEKPDDDDDDEEEKASEEAAETEEEVKSRAKRSVEDDGDEDDKKPAESKEAEATDDADDDDDDDEEEKTDEQAVEEAEDDKAEEYEAEEQVKASEEEEETEDTKSGEEGEEPSDSGEDAEETNADDDDGDDEDDDDEDEITPEDELLWEGEIPENLRDRKHISELLHLDDQYEERENAADRVAEVILRDIKKIYEGAIKPLEALYKYRDLSNRHFGDPEIFSKPLVVFMGPWSGGKSSTINYLTGNEYTQYSLRTGAEPSPAYFNILMWGNKTEVLDGTQLAADYTFSGLQKFGQGLEDRLRGLKLPSKLLEKVNIVEIPGILEVRKQVQRLFPFNDACQWFIDRADMIVLMYDPAKLDAGPETEAILDQLKGREYQTRIILNKADTVHPEELLRVQSALIWNISPLMSSAQPPAMYTTSLWSHPYESGAPVRLLQAQERAFLRDLRTAVDKRIENRIASARRFAVRVRNHAKMVDCYLNTYYNHKTLFGNKKRISDEIIDNPQNYHIYEGLSTLTNISRYDLPDPEVYRDFFRLNPLFEFKKLSDTCTYFGGCPITKLDTAIAYDLPELVGKYKKMAESAVAAVDKKYESLQKDAEKGSS